MHLQIILHEYLLFRTAGTSLVIINYFYYYHCYYSLSFFLFFAERVEVGVTRGERSIWKTNLIFDVKKFCFTFENN